MDSRRNVPLICWMFLIVCVLVLLFLFNSCSTMQKPPEYEPLGRPFMTYAPTPVESHPEDSETFTITVGQARQAIAVEDQFDLLVPKYNENVVFANEIAHERDDLLDYANKVYSWNKVLGSICLVLGAVTATSIIYAYFAASL